MTKRSNLHQTQESDNDSHFFKPIDIKRMARVPYKTVIQWIESGHPLAGILASIDLAAPGKRHSYRIRSDDWAAFQVRLTTQPKTRQHAAPPPRPRNSNKNQSGLFHY